MELPTPLTQEQKLQARQILDEATLHLRTNDEYNIDLNENRETNPLDEVWDYAVNLAEAVGWEAERTGAVFWVRRKK